MRQETLVWRATLCVLTMLVSASVVLGQVSPVRAQHGCDPGNLIPNCNFNTFYDHQLGQIPTDWVPYVLSGSLAYRQHVDTYWGAPSLQMWSDGGTFTAGIYTQVGGLQPGVAYKASMGWGAPTEPNAFGRRLGIDPTGGTDPNSPNIVWGPMHRGPGAFMNDRPPYANIDVSAVAQSPTVTVFVYVDHPYSTGANQIFIDAVSLMIDPVQPAPSPVPPTPVPPTRAPVSTRARPTPQPTAVPTATPSPTYTASPTATFTLTATPTQTPTPTQTYTPSVTPSSTLPPRPRATPSSTAEGTQSSQMGRSFALASVPRGLLWGGFGALAGAGFLAVLVAVIRRR